MGALTRLSNGVRVYVDPMPGLESAAIGVWARAGAIDETADENGVAHLLEHMAFKGTSRRSARGIAEEIEAVGGHLNAATGYQRTGYYARILKNDVSLGMDILADILTDPLFEEAELEKEKEVVVQEIGEANDTPDDAVSELLQTLCFAGQSLGRPILGAIDTVRSHDRDRLRAFMDRRYAAGGLVIAAAGAIDPAGFVALAEALFGGRPAGTGPDRPAPAYVGGDEIDRRDIDQTHIAFAFPAVDARHPDFFATRLFAEAYGGGMSSRLFQKIREERGLAYSAYAYADCYDAVGLIGGYIGTDEANAAEAVRLVREELEASAGDLAQPEIDRARAMLKATMLMSLESPMNRIETAASHILTYGEVLSPATLAARLDAVTVADVRRCAARALREGRPSLAIVGPADLGEIAAAIGV